MRKKHTAAVLALAAVLSLSACGANTESGDTPTQSDRQHLKPLYKKEK